MKQTTKPAPSTRIQRFYVRACFHGYLYVTCSWCGHKNTVKMMPHSWQFTCSGTSCGGTFIPYIGLLPLPPGRPRMPADYRVPETEHLKEAFPYGELNRDPWRGGDRVHTVRMEDEERRKELDTVERFLGRAGRHQGTQVDPDSQIHAMHEELDRMRTALGLGLHPDATTATIPDNVTNALPDGKARRKK